MSIELMIPSNHLILCHPLLLLPSIFSSIKDFSSELALGITWPKYWSFSFSISPSNEYSGLISFKIDWFDLLVVQGVLKSLLQHPNSKASMSSVFYLLCGPALTSTHGYYFVALNIQTFVSKVISLLFKILSRFVIKLSYMERLITSSFPDIRDHSIKDLVALIRSLDFTL